MNVGCAAKLMSTASGLPCVVSMRVRVKSLSIASLPRRLRFQPSMGDARRANRNGHQLPLGVTNELFESLDHEVKPHAGCRCRFEAG